MHSRSTSGPDADAVAVAVANRFRRIQSIGKKNDSNLNPKRKSKFVPLWRKFKNKGEAAGQQNKPNNPLITTTYFRFDPTHMDEPSQYLGRKGKDTQLPTPSSGPATSNAPRLPCAPPVTTPRLPVTTGTTSVVDGNGPHMLEQPKNGRRHKKNTRGNEKSLQRCNTINGQQSDQIPTSQLNSTDQPKKAQESEITGCPTQNMTSGVIIDNHKIETQLQNNVGNSSEVPAEVADFKTMDNSAARAQGLKRRGLRGKGGECMRTNNGSKAVEPSKRVQPKSFYCETCNVKCDLRIDYRNHLKGKKHLNNLKCARGS